MCLPENCNRAGLDHIHFLLQGLGPSFSTSNSISFGHKATPTEQRLAWSVGSGKLVVHHYQACLTKDPSPKANFISPVIPSHSNSVTKHILQGEGSYFSTGHPGDNL